MRFVAGTHTYVIPCCHACGSACQGLHGLIVEHSWKFNGSTMLQILIARRKKGMRLFRQTHPLCSSPFLCPGSGGGTIKSISWVRLHLINTLSFARARSRSVKREHVHAHALLSLNPDLLASDDVEAGLRGPAVAELAAAQVEPASLIHHS